MDIKDNSVTTTTSQQGVTAMEGTAADGATSSAGAHQAGSSSMHPRVNHVHKLERKHSSGDLHSRLKTRKLLGVGETDDGDVHRSKLSQILGHSEQLYTKLPRGLRIWQLVVSLLFSVFSLWALMFPSSLYAFLLRIETTDVGVILAVRLYGSALLSFSIMLWSTLQSTDKDVIRYSLIASTAYFVVQGVVCSMFPIPSSGGAASLSVLFTFSSGWLGLAVILALSTASLYYYWILSQH